MRKVIALALCIITTMAQSAEMRNVEWGMTVDEVKKAETAKFILEKDNMIGYTDKLNGDEILLVYYFTSGKLGKGVIKFDNKRVNNNGYITDFKSINSLLTKKYGQPIESRELWANDLYKNDPQHYGTALATGSLMKYSKWDLDKTEIYHTVTGENFKVSHVIEFSAKKLGKDIEKQREKENLDKL
ncbi:hypothetical protein LPA49_01705 [Pseudoalteromonas sp. MB41]|uniref:hypothetical protein n=1 Tax=Pseudoalteromonas sp. MB41 TaxID=2896366 RepID=UPI001E4A6336|nr:hypothetical protein [Pseudoalteromonas sp. MB41]MCC9659265.1 hypothetical protein [Pseudoalteromonas sp. MB41]